MGLKRVTEDGHATEVVAGVEVRRVISKGGRIPDTWKVEDGSVEDIEEPDQDEADQFASSPAQDPKAHEAARKRDKEALEANAEAQAAPSGPVTSSSASGKSGGGKSGSGSGSGS